MKNKIVIRFFALRSLLIAALILSLGGCSPEPGAQDKTLVENYFSRAEAHVAAGEYSAAIIELKNAIIQSPGHGESRRLLGEIYLVMGYAEAAEKELRAAVEAGVPRDQVLIQLGDALLQQGQMALVLSEIVPLTDLSSTDQARVFAQRGSAYIGQLDRDTARSSFERALELDPHSIPALLGQAALAMADSRQATARQLIVQAINEAEGLDAVEAWRTLGELERIQGNLDAADTAFSQAINISYHPVKLLISRIQVRLQNADMAGAATDLDTLEQLEPLNPQILYGRGVLAVRERRYADAQKLLQEFRNLAPNHTHSLFYLGVSHFELGNIQEAEDALKQVVKKVPESISAKRLLGQSQIRLGDYHAAAQTLEPLLKLQPDDPELLGLLGSIYLKQGYEKRGRFFLERALSEQPGAASTRIKLGFSLLREGKTEAGIDELEESARQNPSSRQIQTMLILGHLKSKDYSTAHKLVEQLKLTYSDDATLHNLRGLIFIAEGKTELARSSFTQALQLQPESVAAATNLASLALRDERPEEARELYQRILQNHTDHLRTLMALARLEQNQGDETKARELVSRAMNAHPLAIKPRNWMARIYFSEGNPQEIIPLFEEIRKVRPNSPDVLAALVDGYLMTENLDEAKKISEKLVEVAPNQARSHYLAARTCAISGDNKCLSASLVDGLRLDPDYPLVPALVERLMELNDSPAVASRVLWKLEDAAPSLTFLSDLRAQNALQLQNGDLAIKIYTRLLDREPSQWVWHERLIKAQVQAGHQQAALVTLQGWLNENPEDYRAMFMLGNAHLRLGNVDKATAVFERIADKDPENAMALNNLAIALKDSDPKRARTYAERAFELAPSFITRDTLGQILLRSGETEYATDLLRQAFTERPESWDIRYHLAEALVTIGRRVEAQGLLQELLAADANDTKQRKKVEELISRLDGLQ